MVESILFLLDFAKKHFYFCKGELVSIEESLFISFNQGFYIWWVLWIRFFTISLQIKDLFKIWRGILDPRRGRIYNLLVKLGGQREMIRDFSDCWRLSEIYIWIEPLGLVLKRMEMKTVCNGDEGFLREWFSIFLMNMETDRAMKRRRRRNELWKSP